MKFYMLLVFIPYVVPIFPKIVYTVVCFHPIAKHHVMQKHIVRLWINFLYNCTKMHSNYVPKELKNTS
jgi:hypothetical protein